MNGFPVLKPNQKLPKNHNFGYITAQNGHFLIKRNSIFEACVPIQERPDLEKQEPFVQITGEMFPYYMHKQAISFLRDVYKKYQSEGLLLLTYNEDAPEDETGWGFYIPEQEVSAASIDYKNDKAISLVGSIHSHPNMTKNPSATDKHDEVDFDGVHIIYNGFDGSKDSITVQIVVNGCRFAVDPVEFIDGLEEETFEYPSEWLEKVSKKTYANILNNSHYSKNVYGNHSRQSYLLRDLEEGTSSKNTSADMTKSEFQGKNEKKESGTTKEKTEQGPSSKTIITEEELLEDCLIDFSAMKKDPYPWEAPLLYGEKGLSDHESDVGLTILEIIPGDKS